ncbi:Pvc16 family protein [Nostoc sp. UHCC 0302]|uniref:Pvc16 family protein n=1 Tax=Nostoc sp. UHCC 0302 TaxID=3134896 RepID=UPI00311CD742
MLISVLQTLAEILAGGTSLTSTEQIDFSHPGNRREQGVGPTLNLYIYDIRESKQYQQAGRQVERNITRHQQPGTVNWAPNWFDVSLLLTAWDRTTLGEHHFLSEALTVLLRHQPLEEEFLVPELRGYGSLPMMLGIQPPLELGGIWSALNVPLRLALYLTISVPLDRQPTITPLVWERIFDLQSTAGKYGGNQVMARRVVIAGSVKSATTNLSLLTAKVTLQGTTKFTESKKEGLFFFENLERGNYVLNINCPGYLPKNVNALVDDSYIFREIFLTPE